MKNLCNSDGITVCVVIFLRVDVNILRHDSIVMKAIRERNEIVILNIKFKFFIHLLLYT